MTQTEENVWIIPATSVTGNYQQLLEQVPTFFNDFIPRGLFYDLTDNATDPPADFDQVSGFGINSIYSLLNTNMNTIQKFRNSWEEEHPNTNNATLFNQYDIQ